MEVVPMIILRINRHRCVGHICRQGDLLLGFQVSLGHDDIL